MKLSAEWITGFVDGEGCFHVAINQHKEMKAKYQVLPEFTVVQHKRDELVLKALKDYFGCGVVRKNHGDRLAFRVRGIKDLSDRIVPFFRKYPLATQKQHDFDKFCAVVEQMLLGEHLSSEGIIKIRSLARQMNRGKLR